MNGDLSSRRILVTGAAQGLGLGIARHLALCGAGVVLTDVNPRLDEHLKEALFERSIGVIQDLAAPDAAGIIVDKARCHFGSIDGLINCAAWSLHRPLGELTVNEFDQLIAVNQRAPLFLSQRFVAQLRESDRDPCIVNISSINAVIGNARLAAYAGTKGALAAMTRALATELAPRVRVVAIAPGGVRTEYTEQLIREGVIQPENSRQRRLIPRFIEVGEIAELVAFLMGPAARSVTGSNWTFDGGYTAH